MSSSGSLFQNTVYVAINVQNILYGVELVLYFKTMRVLLFHGGKREKSDIFYASFSTVMLLTTTVWVSSQALFGQEMWLLNAQYPGGPDAYLAANVSVWYMDLGMTAVILLQLMTDGLMIYRCRVLWDSYLVIIVPAILWPATLALGVLVIWTSSAPGANLFSAVASRLGLAYYSVSVGLTAMLTWAICFRVLTHGRAVKERLGQDYAAVYVSALTLVVESLLPYTLSGIAFLISFGLKSPITAGFAYVYILMMCISPQILILRVASGRAWNEADEVKPSAIKFAPGEGSVWTESHCYDDTGASVHLSRYNSRRASRV